jgi:HEAT repeat protein
MNSREIEALFEQTLVADYDADETWEAIFALRRSGNRDVFERAAEWCRADDPRNRACAAAILLQLRKSEHIESCWLFAAEAYALIVELLEHEEHPLVLDSALSALGHLRNPAAIPLILGYQDHANKDVRFAVAFALGCFPDDERSVGGLLKLTSDPDAEVRDWAVFGLGVLGNVDSPDIREALLQCLDDEDENVREEAAVGLAKRHDSRVMPKLLAMLDEPEVGPRVNEAAAALLGLDSEPSDWTPADYKSALMLKVQS